MIEKQDAKKLAPTVWHKPEHTLLLGCGTCPDKDTCGGLQVRAEIFSCMDFCCGKPESCSTVCPRKSDYAMRVHEIGGFDLTDIRKHGVIGFPELPSAIPLIYRSMNLASPIQSDFIAIPFSQSFLNIGKKALPRSRDELNQKFRISPTAKLCLSGVENDRRVELWWGAHGKAEILASMREMGISFVTIPNFSAIADVPRHDNMHSLKRIAQSWSELHEAKIPSAIHVNCRTDHDYKRFGEFLKYHDEIQAVAFEYTTGTANEECGELYTSSLCGMAEKIGRPLTLILRGGVRWLHPLSLHYKNVVMLDTTACVRTIKRQRADLGPNGHLRWRKSPTAESEPLDELLSHNTEAMANFIKDRRDYPQKKQPRVLRQTTSASNGQLQTDDKSLQGSLL